MFDSNGEPMFDDPQLFDTYDEKMLKGMNNKLIFYEVLYLEHLKISHLLYPVHIFKNVSCSLWRHISSKKSDKKVVIKYLISSNTKKKQWPRKENRGEVGPSFSFKKGDVPWILKKDDLNLEKEVVFSVKVPSFYGFTLLCCFTTDKTLSGLKSHDHLNLLMVCIMSKNV